MSNTVTMTRTYPFPPADVYAAWTNVDILRTWYGCGPDQLWDVHTWDARTGGTYFISMDFGDTVHEQRGTFDEVRPGELLKYTDDQGLTVTVTFTAVAEGCELHLEHSGIPDGDMPTVITGGWTNGLSQLATALSGKATHLAQ